MHPALNLPPIDARIRLTGHGKEEIFDPLRKRFVRLTPEEWVRQHFLHLLTDHKGYPASLVAVEAPTTYNKLKKRSDIVVYARTGQPVLLVECKAAAVPLTQEVFHQVAMYSASFPGSYLVLTNGMDHYVCRIDRQQGTAGFLERIPDYGELEES